MSAVWTRTAVVTVNVRWSQTSLTYSASASVSQAGSVTSATKVRFIGFWLNCTLNRQRIVTEPLFAAPTPIMSKKCKFCSKKKQITYTIIKPSDSKLCISPSHLSDDCRLVVDARERRLRSTTSRTCVVTRTQSTPSAIEYLQLLDPDYGTVFHRSWKTLTYRTIDSGDR